jgi:hypothetical protein
MRMCKLRFEIKDDDVGILGLDWATPQISSSHYPRASLLPAGE